LGSVFAAVRFEISRLDVRKSSPVALPLTVCVGEEIVYVLTGIYG